MQLVHPRGQELLLNSIFVFFYLLLMYRFHILSCAVLNYLFCYQVVITNMDATVMDLDAKKWPDAPADDASSFYKVSFLVVRIDY